MKINKIISMVDSSPESTTRLFLTMVDEVKNSMNIENMTKYETIEWLTGINSHKIKNMKITHNDFIVMLDVYLKIKSEKKENFNEIN